MRLVSEAQKAEAAKKEDGGKSREGGGGGREEAKEGCVHGAKCKLLVKAI